MLEVICQSIPKKPIFMNAVDYKDKIILLKTSITATQNDKVEDAHFYNIFVLLYGLEASNDTCMAYFNKAIKNAPISACNSSFVREGNFRQVYNKSEKDHIILSKMKPLCDSVWNSLDSNLIRILTEVEIEDQRFRKNLVDSYWVSDGKKMMEKQEELDRNNTKIISSIIDSFGYPGRNMVGLELENVAFLVIQHSDLETQQKYLNTIKNASEKNQLLFYAYPLLYDRICMKKNIPQLYGTQTIYDHRKEKQSLYKIDDPVKVNERRKQYGLSTIEYKIKSNGLE